MIADILIADIIAVTIIQKKIKDFKCNTNTQTSLFSGSALASAAEHDGSPQLRTCKCSTRILAGPTDIRYSLLLLLPRYPDILEFCPAQDRKVGRSNLNCIITIR